MFHSTRPPVILSDSAKPAKLRSSKNRSKQADEFRTYVPDVASSSSRQVSRQRSIPTVPSAHEESRRPPREVPPNVYLPPTRSYSHSGKFRQPQPSEDHSVASPSSSASSLFDRRRGGYPSSRSGVDTQEDALPKRQVETQSLRQRRQVGVSPLSNEGSTVAQGPYQTDVSNLWDTVATVASTLTSNVSKAWISNISTPSGEELASDGDSQLIRAIKSYHLAKARDPSDLPDWLFEEHERRPLRSRSQINRRHTEEERSIDFSLPPSSRGLRDIYQTAASNVPAASQERSQRSRFAEEVAAPTKATSRLQALRDAKRNAHLAAGTSL